MNIELALYKKLNLAKEHNCTYILETQTLSRLKESAVDDLDRESPGFLRSYGGESLHEQSHGESFFAVFMNRFTGKGLYILDEPEAALSPSRQMSMITRMNDLIEAGSQFIIATHSPIIMAYPDAIIYEINNEIKPVKYEETEHYQVMKSFINNTQGMLNILIRSNN